MITGEKKQQVDNIWQTFWNNGFTQPSAIFEQITYLLFMKMLDEKQLEKEAIANLTGDKLLNPTFPEGMWHNPNTDQEVPYSEMRWHNFKDMESAIQSPNQKIPDRKTKCVIKTHINIKQNVIFGAKLKPV